MVDKESITGWLRGLQDNICDAMQRADGKGNFREDAWERPGGGGGRTRIMTDGNVIEKGGVNFSAVHGDAPQFLLDEDKPAEVEERKDHPQFYATGVSIVLHPANPHVPIIHMNVRYFEMDGGARWLGGGIDLTPHYIDEEEARLFHSRLKEVCDRHHKYYYTNYKNWADNYFHIRHRGESRGIGGIFFDRLSSDDEMSFGQNLAFWKDVGSLFAPLYAEVIARKKDKPFTGREKQWQLLRRGRYVEFNLVYDKGTRFGLETSGRVESILMSLPRTAGWEYDFKPAAGSPEEQTTGVLRNPRNWVD